MGFKKLGERMSIANLAVSKALKYNRSLKMMDNIKDAVNGGNIEAFQRGFYEVGRSKEGADAYPILMLLKALLLQKWFRIPSEPKIENQINDRISFMKFLGISLDTSSPDHSKFSRFRIRLRKDSMIKLNSEVL